MEDYVRAGLSEAEARRFGAITAIFSVADALLIRPLPYPDSDRLVVMV